MFDINVLISLFDPDHVSHQAAMTWFADNAKRGWATCPITQNGFVRIMSHPSYPNPLPVHALVKRLADACAQPVHEFWADEPTLLDPAAFDVTRIHGPKQITDVYLLGLAVQRGGRLVTFDGGISIAAVRKAAAKHLVIL